MKRSIIFFVTITLSACAVNPVTGERHLQFHGSDWETSVGAQMYAPMKQSEGGTFILDPALGEYVSEVGGRLAAHARRQDELNFEFSIINSSAPNTWALPGGMIAINRGLLAKLDSEAELAAVLGHEIVHADTAHGAPSAERVENYRETARALAAEAYGAAETGPGRWREKTAYLRRVQPAYELYDKAGQAASNKEWANAQKYLDAALAIEPRESLFHALQGDIHGARERPESARKSYNEAVAANPGLYYGWLRRGQAFYAAGDDTRARTDLERSLELMPTAQAHYILGKLDLEANRRVAALEHLGVAARSNSQAGLKAEREILVQDLPERAASYVAAKPVANAAGEVWIQVGNQARTSLYDIEYSYAWIDDAGQTRQGSGVFDGTLEGGKWAQAPLQVRIGNPAELSRRVRVEITAAKVADK